MSENYNDFPNQCGGCKFWVLSALDRGGSMLNGRCHRYPPILVEASWDAPLKNTGFPTVNARSWCGEYTERRGGVPLAIVDIIRKAAEKSRNKALNPESVTDDDSPAT